MRDPLRDLAINSIIIFGKRFTNRKYIPDIKTKFLCFSSGDPSLVLIAEIYERGKKKVLWSVHESRADFWSGDDLCANLLTDLQRFPE